MVSSAKCMEEGDLLSEESYICDGGPPWQAREGANFESSRYGNSPEIIVRIMFSYIS